MHYFGFNHFDEPQHQLQWEMIKKLSLSARLFLLGVIFLGVALLSVIIICLIAFFDSEFQWSFALPVLYLFIPTGLFLLLWYVFKRNRSEKQIQLDAKFLPKGLHDAIAIFLAIYIIPLAILFIFGFFRFLSFIIEHTEAAMFCIAGIAIIGILVFYLRNKGVAAPPPCYRASIEPKVLTKRLQSLTQFMFDKISIRLPISSFLICVITHLFTSCNYHAPCSKENDNSIFFGDSTLTIISSNTPNGYHCKLFKSKDLTLLNLSRGDSINQYIPIYDIALFSRGGIIGEPDSEWESWEDSIGVFHRPFNIPIEKETLGMGIFFMDVNFDNEEEIVVEHPGYNRRYYACFDIVHGEPNIAPGILTAITEPPYNNIVSDNALVSEEAGTYTEFNFKNKTIHIVEQLGCCESSESWCEYKSENEFDTPKVIVVKQVNKSLTAEGTCTEIYTRHNGKLTLTKTINEKFAN